MGHDSTPVAGSSSRKLVQPLVRQYVRDATEAALARRRSRRMVLARPAKVVVAVRDIMVLVLVDFLVRRRRSGPWQQPWLPASAPDSP
jgi:hypothetical protein